MPRRITSAEAFKQRLRSLEDKILVSLLEAYGIKTAGWVTRKWLVEQAFDLLWAKLRPYSNKKMRRMSKVSCLACLSISLP